MPHQPSPSPHHPPAADAPAPAGPGASRRFFLAGTSALALAATAGGTTAWAHGAPAAGAPGGAADLEAQAGTVVAYIRPGESEVTVMSGDRQVVVDDPALVRAIARTLGAR